MKKKKALVSGVTGQDGAYLSKHLLGLGYEVHGIKRRSSSFNTSRLDMIYKDPNEEETDFYLHYGDVTDSLNLVNLIEKIEPDEVYNLAAQSHVKVSFETPEYTLNTDAVGVVRFLEAIKIGGFTKSTRFYQASTSELFGKVSEVPQRETTAFYPRSPYAASKLLAYWMTINYREAYGMYAVNGILFNHESPLRGETFVTQKIARAVANIEKKKQKTLLLGNLDAKRDWGHAKDYVEGMVKILNYKTPEDFVLATGRSESIRYFAEIAFSVVGRKIHWQGEGESELGHDSRTGEILVAVDPKYYRPTEVDLLQGDASKAKELLNWEPQISLEELVSEMVHSALESS